MNWPDRRILDRLGIEVPIIQAPMGGVATSAMVTAVARRGETRLVALRVVDVRYSARGATETIQRGTNAAINLNFFAHAFAPRDDGREAAWRQRLAPITQLSVCAPTRRCRRSTSRLSAPNTARWSKS